MKFETINRRFTETVTAWIAKGYTINTATMGGHQGEIAKIDLTDGKEIIRILLDEDSKIERIDRDGKPFICDAERVTLLVGRSTEEGIVPNAPDTFGSTIWNERLEEISREEFYKIGGRRRDSNWYGTRDEMIAQQIKHSERYSANYTPNSTCLCDKAKEIVLSFVRRQPKCKSAKASEIESVTKHDYETRAGKRVVKYTVKVRGQVLDLH